MTEYRYFQITDETLSATCRDWRQRYMTGRRAIINFAVSMGAEAFSTGFDGGLLGLKLAEVPKGWRRQKPGSEVVVPAKGPKGDGARAAIAALPAMPRTWELAEMVGHRGVVNYKADSVRGSEILGFISPVFLLWAGDEMALLVADSAPTVAKILGLYPDAEFELLWSPPPGLTEITKAQWDLIEARHAVEREAATG